MKDGMCTGNQTVCLLLWMHAHNKCGGGAAEVGEHGQIKDEACMEDLNNLLNGGEVPNLFPADERLQAAPKPQHSIELWMM